MPPGLMAVAGGHTRGLVQEVAAGALPPPAAKPAGALELVAVHPAGMNGSSGQAGDRGGAAGGVGAGAGTGAGAGAGTGDRGVEAGGAQGVEAGALAPAEEDGGPCCHIWMGTARDLMGEGAWHSTAQVLKF